MNKIQAIRLIRLKYTFCICLREKYLFSLAVKLLLNILIVINITTSAFAQTSSLFNENFSGGIGQFNGSGSVSTGSYGVRLRGSFGDSDGVIISNSISTIGFSSIILSLNRTVTGLDAGESAQAAYSVNGGPYILLESIGNLSGTVNLSLGNDASNQADVRLRFSINASSFLERYEIASVVLTGTASEGGGDHGITQRKNPSVLIPIEGPGNEQGDPVLQEAFPNLPLRGDTTPFIAPTLFAAVPGANKNVVVEQDGRIIIFENNSSVSTSTVFLDITDRVGRPGFYNAEQGLLSCAFDPNYISNGYFYCYYTRSPDGASVLSRFQRSAGNPNQANPNSEIPLITISQPGASHNGGMLAFSPMDNFLYLSTGDGGCCDDPHGGSTGTSQDRTNLLGSVIRIAPETDDNGGYQIPANNPFGQNRCPNGQATNGQPCGEIFHFGLRNPWRFSFDSLTGDGWIGDVGQDAREEIDLWFAGESGLNFGWSCREGFIAGPKPNVASCDTAAERRDPILDYVTGPNEAVIGGYVYRGSSVAQLQGKYVYSRLGLREIHTANSNGNNELLFSTGSRMVYSFGEDADKELYAVYNNGDLEKFVTSGGSGGGDVPSLLSQTGIYSDIVNLKPAIGLVPYEVNSQLFSDNLQKSRFFAVPINSDIIFDASGRWRFPVGSAVVKNFFFLDEAVETRVLVRGSEQWRGYVYKWNETKTDAVLVDPPGETVSLPGGVLYDLPSQANCQTCHNIGSGSNGPTQIIGLQTRQLNTDFYYPETDVVDNQLQALNHVSYFDQDIGAVEQYGLYPDYNDPNSGTLEARAKAYLDINCGVCHRAGGGTPVNLNLEYDISDTQRNIFGITATQGEVNGAALIVDPGNKENSVLWQRMQLTLPDNRSMPPIAHRQIDFEGVQLIGEWIDNLPPIVEPALLRVTGYYREGGGLSSTPDELSLTNVGDSSVTQIVIDLRDSNGAVFDPDGVNFTIVEDENTGFDGNFSLSGSNQVLTLYFTHFDSGESFNFGVDVDDMSGYTTGADFAGSVLTATGAVVASGVYQASGSDTNRAEALAE